MSQEKTRYVVFARPKDSLIVEEFHKIASLTTMELINYLKINKDEEFLAVRTPYYIQTLEPSSHPFEGFLNVIQNQIVRDTKPESRFSRPDYYIAILPFSEYSDKDFTIYVDVEILNPKLNENEEQELSIPPFPVSFRTSEISSYSDLKSIIMSKFPFAVEIGETPKFSINISKDGESDSEYQKFDLADENTGEFPRPSISDFLDSYLYKSRIKVSTIIDKKSITKIRHRVSIIKEIKTTEQTFINGLHDLLSYYQTKFKEHKMLSFEEDQKVFKNIPLIITAHETLLGQLEQAKQTYASHLSSLFIEFSNYFKVSKLYISQYSAIIQMFLEKKKDKDFARKFQEVSKNHVELNSLLITPVQRMPRYILFLRELIKFTPPSHPDAPLLKTAEKLLQEVTLDIEKASTEAENQAMTSTIQDKIGKDTMVIIKPNRVFLLSIKIDFIKPKQGPGMIYLFNDLILIVSERESSDLSNNCQIVLAQTPVEFKYSAPSIYTIAFMSDGNPISQAVTLGVQRSPSIPLFSANNNSSENLDKKEKKSKSEKKEEKHEKEKKKEEEKREKERKKQKLTIVEFKDVNEKAKLMSEIHKAKSKFYNKDGEKRSYFKFVALDLKAVNYEDLFLSDADGAYNPEKKILYIFGGNPLNSNLLIINVFTGSVMIKPTTIPPRMNHSVTFYQKPDSSERYLLIFGGKGEGNEPLNDLYQINLSNDETVEIITKKTLEPRYGHTAAVFGDRFYVFGGMNKKKVFNDVCYITLSADPLLWFVTGSITGYPSPRAFHSGAVVGDKWYIFGGVNDKKASVFSSKASDENDALHILDFKTNDWQKERIPHASRAWHRLISVGSFVIIIGGLRELDLEPIVVYDTNFKKVFTFASGFNYPSFLTSFFGAFVNPTLPVLKNSSLTSSLTRLNSEEGETSQGIKRTTQPHLLLFGGINPITKDQMCSLYEVKIPSVILEVLKNESLKKEPTLAARARDPKKRAPDSIPIGSTVSAYGENEDDLKGIPLNSINRSVTTMTKAPDDFKEFKKRLTEMQGAADSPITIAEQAARLAKTRESRRIHSKIPRPANKDRSSEQSKSEPQSSDEQTNENEKQEQEQQKSKNQSSSDDEPLSTEPKPEQKATPEPKEPEPTPQPPEEEPPKKSEPKPTEEVQDEKKPEEPANPNLASSIAERLAVFTGSPVPHKNPNTQPPSSSSSATPSQPQPPAEKPAPSQPQQQPQQPKPDDSDFDETSFCESIGIDPSGLIAYQRRALTNKLKVLYGLKEENKEMESKIASSQTKESILHYEAFNYYGKVIVNKKLVKIIQLSSDSNIEQVKEQIKEDCSGSITDSMIMIATNKPLDSASGSATKDTSQVELALMLNTLSSQNSSHINFCFQ